MSTKKKLPNFSLAFAWLLAGVLLPSLVLAEEASPSAFSLRGFGTFGFARSTNDQAEVTRDIMQPSGATNRWTGKIDSNVGMQVNYAASDTVEAVVQAVSRLNYNGNYAPQVTEAFLKYEPNAYLSLRGGRVSTDIFMHSDARLIGYSQLAARPSIDYFSALSIYYLDGLDVQATIPFNDGLLRNKTFYGRAQEKVPYPTGFLDLQGAQVLGTYLDYQKGNWQWRASYAQIRFNHPMPPPANQLREALINTGVSTAQQAAARLNLEDTYARFYSLGTVYENGPFMAQLMLGRFGYGSAIIQNQNTGMFLAGYRIGELTPFAGYSKTKSQTKQVPTGLPNVGATALLNASLATVLADSHTDQHTVTIGLRWDFRRNTAIKFQADAIRGEPDSICPVRRETANWDGKTNLFSIALDFVF